MEKTLAMSDHVEGALVVLAVLAVPTIVIIWMWVWSTFGTEIIWAKIRRMNLGDPDSIARNAAIVGAARRAYLIRIPTGVRIVVSLGGRYEDQLELYHDLVKAQELRREREDRQSRKVSPDA